MSFLGAWDHQRRGGGTVAGRPRRRLRPAVVTLEGRELLSTLTVSNTNDSGTGSLRAAVLQANTDGGATRSNSRACSTRRRRSP
jgi:hypothetical protein